MKKQEIIQRFQSISDDSKEWLLKTIERFEDGQCYDRNPHAINECLAAGLIEKRKHSRIIEIDGRVVDAIYPLLSQFLIT